MKKTRSRLGCVKTLKIGNSAAHTTGKVSLDRNMLLTGTHASPRASVLLRTLTNVVIVQVERSCSASRRRNRRCTRGRVRSSPGSSSVVYKYPCTTHVLSTPEATFHTSIPARTHNSSHSALPTRCRARFSKNGGESFNMVR